MSEHYRRTEHRVIGLSLHFGNGEKKVVLPDITPPSTTHRLGEATKELGSLDGLDTDQIARKCFQSIQFRSNDTTVLDGRTYYHLSKSTDERVKQTLYTLFGVRLSIEELDSNIENLELNRFGWVEQIENTKLDLSKRVAHAKIAEIALLACSSLSPMMVNSVSAVLSSLADSLQSMSAVLQKHTIDANLFSTDDSTIILVNSRFSTEQMSSKWFACLCGLSQTRILLSLQIRRIGFSTAFCDLIRTDSPLVRRRIQKERHLLPPSPEFTTRSATAPSSVPIRLSSRATPRLQAVQMEALGLRPWHESREVSRQQRSDTEPLSPSPLSIVRELAETKLPMPVARCSHPTEKLGFRNTG